MSKKPAFHTVLYFQLILTVCGSVITAAVSRIISPAALTAVLFLLGLSCGSLPYLLMLPYGGHFKKALAFSIINSALLIPQRLIGEALPYSIILSAASAAISCLVLYFFIKGIGAYFENMRQALLKHKKSKNTALSSFKAADAEKLCSRWRSFLTVLIIFHIIVTVLLVLINLLPDSVPKEPLLLFAGIFSFVSLILAVYRLWLTFKTAVLAKRAHALQPA